MSVSPSLARIGGGRSLEAIAEPVTADEVKAATARSADDLQVLRAAQHVRMAALGRRLAAAKLRMEWGVRDLDWRACQAAARAAAGLPTPKWQDWRARVQMQQEQMV